MRKTITDFNLDWAGLTLLAARRWDVDKTPFDVEIGEPKRSNKQNELIHALFKQCADKTKLKNPEWWKTELKSKLGKKEVHFDLEENPTVIVVSTRAYKKKEISDFVIKIQQHMMENYEVSIDTNDILQQLGE